jgi:hypothetical protein
VGLLGGAASEWWWWGGRSELYLSVRNIWSGRAGGRAAKAAAGDGFAAALVGIREAGWLAR